MSRVRQDAQVRLDDVLTYMRQGSTSALTRHLADEVERVHLRKVVTLPPGAKFAGPGPQDPFSHAIADVLARKTIAYRPDVFASATVAALAAVADGKGMLALDEVERRYGPDARVFLEDVLGEVRAGRVKKSGARDDLAIELFDLRVARLVGASARDGGLAKRMPVVGETVRALLTGEPHPPGEGFDLSSLGHELATTGLLHDAYAELGIPPPRQHTTGKGYSRHPDTLMRLLAKGHDVDEKLLFSYEYEKNLSMEEKRAVENLKRMFEGIDPATTTKRFLIHDDGAYQIVALHQHPELRRFAHLCHCVEQTTHGLNRIRELIGEENLLCPVISVADCWLKTQIESKVIGEAVVSSLERELHAMHSALTLDGAVFGLVGYGKVGSEIEVALSRRGVTADRFWVSDLDTERVQAARNRGLHTASTRDVLRNASVVFTATGRKAIDLEEFEYAKDQSILVNAGSGHHEASMNELGVHQRGLVAKVEGKGAFFPVADLSDAPRDQPLALALLDQGMQQYTRLRGTPPKVFTFLGYDERTQELIDRLQQRYGVQTSQIAVIEPEPARRPEIVARGLRVVGESRLAETELFLAGRLASEVGRPMLSALKRGAAFVAFNDVDPSVAPIGQGKTPKHDEHQRMAGEWMDTGTGEFRGRFRGVELKLGNGGIAGGYRHRVVRTGRGSSVLVPRSGFVINLTQGMPPEYAQLLISLLLGAGAQAMKTKEPGLHAVSNELQHFILGRTRKDLVKKGLSLDSPDFRGLDDWHY